MAGRQLRSTGISDVGRQRTVNEDRLHIDTSRGVFIVIDGVGGQAAGGKAADIAVAMLRERLERQTGPVADRVREAITIANNEIHRAAGQRAEWNGMACVLTVAVVEDGRMVIGHVGDTRLYLFRGNTAQKVTPDHSPVGEREDAREITEAEAMRHPRRNEVFRDVGSSARELTDPGFMFLSEIDFPPDAAMLLCSDGLTDLVPLEAIKQIVHARKGQPEDVARDLIGAANAAGGKDNVTVVYVEGERFAAASRPAQASPTPEPVTTRPRGRSRVGITLALVALALAGFGAWMAWDAGWRLRTSISNVLTPGVAGAIVVTPAESIAAAIERAAPGSTVVVEPGEYRERLTMKDNVRLISRVPRAATLRLPSNAGETEPLVIAAGVTGAELNGFRIVGDAASSLGVGIITRDAGVRLVDLEITGASIAGIDFGPGDDVVLIGSDIHDNHGSAFIARSGATARVAHNVMSRNGTSNLGTSALVIEAGALPTLSRNVFHGTDAQALVGSEAAARLSLPGDNWFIDTRAAVPAVRAGAPVRRAP